MGGRWLGGMLRDYISRVTVCWYAVKDQYILF